MARKYAKVLVSINDDPDWWALSPPARDLYFTLLIRPEISHCGVADWRPAKIARRSTSTPLAAVRKAADELAAARFIVIDEDSEEVLIRSFVRNDGVLTDNPKGAGAVLRALFAIGSRTLRNVVVEEAQRLLAEQPELASFQAKNGGSELVKVLTQEPKDRPGIDVASTSDRRPNGDAIADTHPDGTADGIDARSTPDPLVPNTSHLLPEETTTTTTSSATASPTEATKPRPEIQRLCDLLSDLVADRGSKRPKASAQYDPCRLMLDRDHRTVEQIEWLIRWSQADPFWHQNIRSMAKLREQWDTLRLKATANRASTTTAATERRNRPRGSAFGMGWQHDTTDRSAS